MRLAIPTDIQPSLYYFLNSLLKLLNINEEDKNSLLLNNKTNIKIITSNYTIQKDDDILLCRNSEDIFIYSPSITLNKEVKIIKDINNNKIISINDKKLIYYKSFCVEIF